MFQSGTWHMVQYSRLAPLEDLVAHWQSAYPSTFLNKIRESNRSRAYGNTVQDVYCTIKFGLKNEINAVGP